MPDRVPNAQLAKIDSRKLRDYALNPEHLTGHHKAAFLKPMGYTPDNWAQLEKDIREQHLTQPAEPGQASVFGRKYTITAPLQGPLREPRWVTTVWIIPTASPNPELVTILPADPEVEIGYGHP